VFRTLIHDAFVINLQTIAETGQKVIAVKDHKTGNHQIACFAVTPEDYEIMSGYNRRVSESIAQVKAPNSILPNRKLFFVRPPKVDKLESGIKCGSDEVCRYTYSSTH
jgi:hypothetical protein